MNEKKNVYMLKAVYCRLSNLKFFLKKRNQIYEDNINFAVSRHPDNIFENVLVILLLR